MKSVARALASTIHGLARSAAVLAAVAMTFIMVIVVYNVVLRELHQPPLRGIVEYVEVGMAIAAFLALGETERRRRHVGVDEILERLKGPVYAGVRIAGTVASVFIVGILAWTAGVVFFDSVSRGEFRVGLIQIPMWPARLAVFAGFIILALEQLVSGVEDVMAHLSGNPPEIDYTEQSL
jgi:TRAP-type C4-dicarboxylate transport system permease small subunit